MNWHKLKSYHRAISALTITPPDIIRTLIQYIWNASRIVKQKIRVGTESDSNNNTDIQIQFFQKIFNPSHFRKSFSSRGKSCLYESRSKLYQYLPPYIMIFRASSLSLFLFLLRTPIPGVVPQTQPPPEKLALIRLSPGKTYLGQNLPGKRSKMISTSLVFSDY